jgi:hypothetical protein
MQTEESTYSTKTADAFSQEQEHSFNIEDKNNKTQNEINLIIPDNIRRKQFANRTNKSEIGNKAKEGAGAGAVIGGMVGTTVGIVAAVGTTLVLPGLGVVVSGPIIAGFAGAGAGAATGSLIGALVGYGIPEDRSKRYENIARNKNTIMSIYARQEDNGKELTKNENDWITTEGEEIHDPE